jgi:hypothetical protein
MTLLCLLLQLTANIYRKHTDENRHKRLSISLNMKLSAVIACVFENDIVHENVQKRPAIKTKYFFNLVLHEI